MGVGRETNEAFADWLAPHLVALRRVGCAFAVGADLHDLMLAVWKARPRFQSQELMPDRRRLERLLENYGD